MLGASRIASLGQDKKNAKAMNVAYQPVKRNLIRQYDWSFAIKRDSIAAQSTQTTWGELNRFALPNDYLRLLRNKEIDFRDHNHDWTPEGRYIVTADAAPLQIRYIADITDPTLHDATFDEALSALLAAECCEEITQSNTKKEKLREGAADQIKIAFRLGAIEKGPQEVIQDTWLDSRL